MKKVFNIILVVLLIITAILTVMMLFGPKDGSGNPDVNMIIIWTYILCALAILSAIFSAVYCSINSSRGSKGSLIALVIVVLVVGASFMFADSTTPMVLSDGTVVDSPMILSISDASLYVSYVALAVAIVAAIFSEIKNAIK